MLLQGNKCKGFFITGTDTNVGKTLVTASLLIYLAKCGFTTVAMKPVASGCLETAEGLRNDDAIILQKYATCKLMYAEVNPFTFRDPIAPHIAAKNSETKLTVKSVLSASEPALTTNADYMIIEGAGGWYVPLNKDETIADLALSYGYPVILVVGIRLGCINHALLTLKAIEDAKINIKGWVANIIDKNMLYVHENIQTIENSTEAKLLGIIPYQVSISPENTADFLSKIIA
jgi:dethiobiotin synthase